MVVMDVTHEVTRARAGLDVVELLTADEFGNDHAFLMPIRRDRLKTCRQALGEAQQACRHYEKLLEWAERLARDLPDEDLVPREDR